jgi:hypothetical protein
VGRRFRKELESNETVKLDVLGFIKQPHAAPAELLDDAVVGDSLADERLGIKGCRVEASSLGRNRNVALLVPTLSTSPCKSKKIESCVRWAKGHHCATAVRGPDNSVGQRYCAPAHREAHYITMPSIDSSWRLRIM